jgi:hypothetical protein
MRCRDVAAVLVRADGNVFDLPCAQGARPHHRDVLFAQRSKGKKAEEVDALARKRTDGSRARAEEHIGRDVLQVQVVSTVSAQGREGDIGPRMMNPAPNWMVMDPAQVRLLTESLDERA